MAKVKVGELIEILQGCNPRAEVFVQNDLNFHYRSPFGRIEEAKKGRQVTIWSDEDAEWQQP